MWSDKELAGSLILKMLRTWDILLTPSVRGIFISFSENLWGIIIGHWPDYNWQKLLIKKNNNVVLCCVTAALVQEVDQHCSLDIFH